MIICLNLCLLNDEINYPTLCIWTKKNHIWKSLNACHWRHCEWWLKQQSVGLHLFGKQWRHTNFPTIHRSPLHVLLLFLPLQHSAATRKCCLRPLHVVQSDKNLSEFLFLSLYLNDFKISFSNIHFQCLIYFILGKRYLSSCDFIKILTLLCKCKKLLKTSKLTQSKKFWP